MSDVVARLLDKIEEIEFAATTAAANEGGARWVSNGEFLFAVQQDGGERPVAASVTDAGWAEETGAHLTINDPESVLRLCRAHRDLIDEWRKRKQMADQLGADEDTRDGDAHAIASGIAAGLHAAVVLVARGLGVEE